MLIGLGVRLSVGNNSLSINHLQLLDDAILVLLLREVLTFSLLLSSLCRGFGPYHR